MNEVSTIGVDLAKSVFQVHGADAQGHAVFSRKLRRRQVLPFFAKLPPCLIGLEACATAHHWARELEALGHRVRLLPPRYVKAYVKRGKTDAADAAAICEAVTRPALRAVPVKSIAQQSVLMLHRSRELLIRQRTQTINALRAHLAEFGIAAPTGREGLTSLLAIVADSQDRRLPALARAALQSLASLLVAARPRDRPARSRHPDRAAGRCGEPPARQRARHRAAGGERVHGHRRRCAGVPVGAQLCRLAGLDAAPRRHRWQGDAGADHQAGRPLSQAAPGRGRGGGAGAGPAAARTASTGSRAARQTEVQAGGGGTRQQDGARRLGAAGHWRELSARPPAGGAGGGGVRLGKGNWRHGLRAAAQLRGCLMM